VARVVRRAAVESGQMEVGKSGLWVPASEDSVQNQTRVGGLQWRGRWAWRRLRRKRVCRKRLWRRGRWQEAVRGHRWKVGGRIGEMGGNMVGFSARNLFRPLHRMRIINRRRSRSLTDRDHCRKTSRKTARSLWIMSALLGMPSIECKTRSTLRIPHPAFPSMTTTFCERVVRARITRPRILIGHPWWGVAPAVAYSTLHHHHGAMHAHYPTTTPTLGMGSTETRVRMREMSRGLLCWNHHQYVTRGRPQGHLLIARADGGGCRAAGDDMTTGTTVGVATTTIDGCLAVRIGLPLALHSSRMPSITQQCSIDGQTGTRRVTMKGRGKLRCPGVGGDVGWNEMRCLFSQTPKGATPVAAAIWGMHRSEVRT